MRLEEFEPLPEKDLKKDQGKLRYDLVPFDALDDVVRVYMMGAEKYQERSWERGIRYSRVFAALLRHLFAWWHGDDRDTESGLPHLAHVAWNALALLTYTKRGQHEMDDRAKNVAEEGPHAP